LSNADTAAPDLVFDHVHVCRGGRPILEDVCAVVPAGSSTVIVGPNGAGKTTLLLCLIGEMPYTGRIIAAGRPDLPRTAYVPQHLFLDASLPLRVGEFLALNRQRRPLWLGLRGPERAKARDLLRMVRAEQLEDRRMSDLSGGETRRVLLAAALGRAPRLLVLDEPAAGVDVQGERLFWEVLDEARKQQGFTQLMVSHNLSLAAHYATHIICLNRKVCAEGAPHEALGASVLTQLFGVPIHLYPDQCAPDDPSCPQCGAVCAPERLLPDYASVKRREAALHQQGSAAMHVPPDAVSPDAAPPAAAPPAAAPEGKTRAAREADHA